MDTAAMLAFLLEHPRVQPIWKRQGFDEAQHRYYDAMLIDLTIRSGWADEDTLAFLQESYVRNFIPLPPSAYAQVMVTEAHLRLQTEHPSFAEDEILHYLSEQWGLNITKVIRHGVENAIWHIRTDAGHEIRLGSSADLFAQTPVRTAIFDRTGHVIPRYQNKTAYLWDQHITLLATVAEVVNTPEMTRKGTALQLLLGYLELLHCPLDHDTDPEEWEGLALGNRPFMREGDLHIHLRHWWLHYVHEMQPSLTQADLTDLARLIGFKRVTIACNESGTSRSYWKQKATGIEKE